MEELKRICELTRQHQELRRSSLNMIASESVTSPLVESMLASDFSRRYYAGSYAGSEFFRGVFEITTELAKEVFDVEYADIRPATGNIAGLSVITGLGEPGSSLVTTAGEHGGYPLRLAQWANMTVIYHPFDLERFNIDSVAAEAQILKEKPDIVVFGASKLLFPAPIKQLREAAEEVGATIWYDGAHVMGLIAGGCFQNPLAEGADVMTGSTHKTLPGPQRGIVLTNSKDVAEQVGNVLSHSPFLVSCIHNNTVAALGVALAEFKEFGRAYALQVTANAKALGAALQSHDLPLFGGQHGITESHQVLLKTSSLGCKEALQIRDRLEQAGIIASPNRFGTQEITRLGMREPEMGEIAGLIADVVLDRRPLEKIRTAVREMASQFTTIAFSYQDGEEAYSLIGRLL